MSNPRKPKILAIDIETAPHTAHVWGLFNQFVGINQIMDTGRVLCFAWKWLNNEPNNVKFTSELIYSNRKDFIKVAHELLEEADIVVTYNGKKFDIPTLNKEFLESGLSPPSPYKHVDLYQTARRQFRFASNKMDHVAKELGIKAKIKHTGHELWVSCMAGDEKAWRLMERYNKRDVLILDKLYKKMLPWIHGHPNVSLYLDTLRPVCPHCGKTTLQSRGLSKSKSFVYQRYQCTSCGSWSRQSKRDKSFPTPEVVNHAPL